MKIIQLQLNKIKPDPNQPRKFFSEEKIEKLAKTFKTTGIINAIEVDKSYMIITGENRYRAAKLAGWKTVPCKILDISDDDRFIRQLIENIHSANLKPIEIGKALQKILAKRAARFARDKFHKSEYHAKGIKELHEELGMDEDQITIYLDLLKQSEPLKQAIQEGLPVTHIRSLRNIPQEHRATLEKKLIKGELKTRDASRYIVNAIKRNPDKADEILAKDYSKYKTAQEVGEVVAKISPRLSDLIGEGLKPPQELDVISVKLHDWCERNSPQNIGTMYQVQIALTLSVMQDDINNWIKSNKQ